MWANGGSGSEYMPSRCKKKSLADEMIRDMKLRGMDHIWGQCYKTFLSVIY
jgi:hypothetical protein